MCNDYGNRIPYSAYLEAFSHLKIRLFARGGAPNLEPRDDIWPTDVAPIIRANKDGAELIQFRWGFPPGQTASPGRSELLREGSYPSVTPSHSLAISSREARNADAQ